MATSGNLSSSPSGSSSNKGKRDERRLLVDEATTSTTSTNNFHLPPDILEEILSLLPNKSIHRFRSVSKSWSSLLVSVDFHFFRCKSTPPKKTILGVLSLLPSYSQNNRSHRFVLSSLYPDALEHADTKESYPFQKLLHCRFVGSCNGLVCLEQYYYNHSKPEIVVWNPFTGVYRKLPDHMSMLDRRYAHGFGYDSASDDYKVFIATSPNDYGDGVRVHIFSLKARGPWKEVENSARELQHIIREERMGLFLNGALHWQSENVKDGTTKITAFDLAREKFYDVPQPPSTQDQLSPLNYENYCMGVVGEEYLCVSFMAKYQPNKY
ncbi:hypothetical protein Tsubulata_029507 [Turnera subulata]|uniref:F-box domain-containing protein n=1 Tax=Turnera subulata TaxID=218843 RepID=A0A9Q0FYP8_9ROSI|nr:hypothetical protein Tsubulata_029507 [Turnera subulata]